MDAASLDRGEPYSAASNDFWGIFFQQWTLWDDLTLAL